MHRRQSRDPARWDIRASTRGGAGGAAVSQNDTHPLLSSRTVAELDQTDHDEARGELGEQGLLASNGACQPGTSLNFAVSDGRSLAVVRARTCKVGNGTAVCHQAGGN